MRALLVALLLLAAAAPATASRPPATCSTATIRSAVLDAGKPYNEGPQQVICRDVNGDGTRDALFSLFSGGTAGATRFGVIDGGSTVLQFYGEGYKIALDRVTSTRFDVQQPVYGKLDANCCPSSFRATVYKFADGTFKAGRTTKYKKAKDRFGE